MFAYWQQELGVIFGIETSVYLVLTYNDLSPGGDHSNSELCALSALSAVAQSLQITWGNLSPPVSAGRLALQLITGAAQITFLQEVNILNLLSFNKIF